MFAAKMLRISMVNDKYIILKLAVSHLTIA